MLPGYGIQTYISCNMFLNNLQQFWPVPMSQTIHWLSSGVNKGQGPLPIDSQDAAAHFDLEEV